MRHRGALVAVAIALLVGCEKKKPDELARPGRAGPSAASNRVLLGHVASLTGNEAASGESSDRGIRLAVEEVNARGGVRGMQVSVKTYDDQGRQDEASNVATRLATADHATVMLGGAASKRSLAMAAAADRYQLPMVSPSATNPKVTRDDGGATRPYAFRTCFVEAFQGTLMAGFARETLKLSRVAVLRDAASDYSVGLADSFLTRFKELGGTIVDDESYKAGNTDFRVQLNAIRRRNPEAVYVPGFHAEVALVARQARELGMRQPFLGGDGWDSEKLYENARGALEGSFFSNHYSAEDPSPRVQEFVKRYQARYGAVPDVLAAQAYDAAGLAMDAVARAKDLSGPAVREALTATKGYPGITGAITIGADHDAVRPVVVLEVRNGAGRYAATVEPDGRITLAPAQAASVPPRAPAPAAPAPAAAPSAEAAPAPAPSRVRTATPAAVAPAAPPSAAVPATEPARAQPAASSPAPAAEAAPASPPAPVPADESAR
jgi:branched-chain amino acid transport system substrate-binding protein